MPSTLAQAGSTRSEQRLACAEYLNSISGDELFRRFGITRVGDITGLDCIGVPVYSSARPAARSVSVSAGKSRDKRTARAGAIAEGIEFATFENPIGLTKVARFMAMEPALLPTARGSRWTPRKRIAQELVTHWASGEERWFPSELVWIVKRRHTRRNDFQMTSNGQALGATFEDAFLQGLLECVERDQTVLRICSKLAIGIYPPRVSFERCSSESILDLYEKCRAASLKLYLFYCNVDIPIPVYWAILVDPFGGAGTYAGWGCDLDPARAAERAILESIQSRGVYIAGARDDIERRNFDLVKCTDPKEIMAELDEYQPVEPIDGVHMNTSTQEQLDIVLERLGPWKENIYFKHVDLGDVHAVKTIILGLEQPRGELWREQRYSKLAAKFMCENGVPLNEQTDILARVQALL